MHPPFGVTTRPGLQDSAEKGTPVFAFPVTVRTSPSRPNGHGGLVLIFSVPGIFTAVASLVNDSKRMLRRR